MGEEKNNRNRKMHEHLKRYIMLFTRKRWVYDKKIEAKIETKFGSVLISKMQMVAPRAISFHFNVH